MKAKMPILDAPLSLDDAVDSAAIQTVLLKAQLSGTGYFDLKKYLHDTLIDSLPPSPQLKALLESFTKDTQKFLLDSMFKSVEQELTGNKLDYYFFPLLSKFLHFVFFMLPSCSQT